MSSRRKSSPSTAAVRFPPLGLIIALAVMIAGVWWAFLRDIGEKGGGSPGSQKPEFQRLVGKWVRPDGGYILEIRSVGSDGKLDATYSNPRPINVAKAEATASGGEIKVFVELRDQNYPGSIYSLTFHPELDRLAGSYFQAALQETYEIVFERTE